MELPGNNKIFINHRDRISDQPHSVFFLELVPALSPLILLMPKSSFKNLLDTNRLLSDSDFDCLARVPESRFVGSHQVSDLSFCWLAGRSDVEGLSWRPGLHDFYISRLNENVKPLISLPDTASSNIPYVQYLQ